MKSACWLLLVLFTPALALADTTAVPPQEHPVLRDIVNTVSAAELKAIDTTLAGFGDRKSVV